MNYKQIYKLLRILQESDEVMGSEKCATYLGMSTSSFRKELGDANCFLKDYGVQILGKSGKGNGYQLVISDQNIFNTFYEKTLPSMMNDCEEDFTSSRQRVSYLLETFLQNNNYFKSTDLCEKLAISSTQLTKDLKGVRDVLAKYDLNLVNRPYYGLKVEGDEYHLRLCLAYVMNIKDITKNSSNSQDKEFRNLKRIEELIVNTCAAYDYSLTGVTLDNLVVHLYVSLKRVQKHQDMELSKAMKDEICKENGLELAKAIISKMEEEFHLIFYEDEVYYVAIHLAAKRIEENREGEVEAPVMSLVDKMLKEIKDVYNIDLLDNLDLRMMLCMHITPLIDRIKYHVSLQNPMIEEIKTKLLFAYELALCCAKVINEEYNINLCDDEIGYFALPLMVAINELKTVKKKDILLVCATGRGSAQLLRYGFESRFANEINSLETCDVIKVSTLDLSKYDAIFTTVPLPEVKNVPVFIVDSFLDHKQENVSKFFKSTDMSSFEQIFRPDMFFVDIEATSKEQLICEASKRLREVCDLPIGFEEAVIERENIAATNFSKDVAFPHPNRVLTNETFVSVIIPKEPIDWGTSKVQLVLLASFSKSFIKTNEDVVRVISMLINDKKALDKLLGNPSYGTLLKLINGLEGN